MHIVEVNGLWIRTIKFDRFYTEVTRATYTLRISHAYRFEYLSAALKAARKLGGRTYKVHRDGTVTHINIDI